MKDAYYFRHDANARNDEKILELRAEFGWEGYGLYWALIETLREAPEYKLKTSLLNGQAVSLCIAKSKLIALIDFCASIGLLCKDDEAIWSDSLCRRMEAWDNNKAMFAEAGRKGAAKRWPKPADSLDNTPVNSPPINHPNSPPINGGNSYKNKEEENRKEKRRIEKETPLPPYQGEMHDSKKNEGIDEKVHQLHIGPTFEEFWEAYDHKQDRPKCEKIWAKMSLKDRETVMVYLTEYVPATAKVKDVSGKTIRKYPYTFLYNKAWENELPNRNIFSNNPQNPNRNANQNSSRDGLKAEWSRRVASR